MFCLRKADWNALLTLLITLHWYQQSKTTNSLTCRGLLMISNSSRFCLPAYHKYGTLFVTKIKSYFESNAVYFHTNEMAVL